jgi:RNase P subunit RPR2
MKSSLTKSQAEKEIKEFFEDMNSKTPKEIKKIKKLAMKYSIKLGKQRRLFCKKCFTPYSANSKIRIKKGIRLIECPKCKLVSRYKI